MKFMAKGRALVEYAVEGDLEGLKKIFLEEGEEMQNLMKSDGGKNLL